MEKTKKFIESELQKYNDLYWKWNSKLENKKKILEQLQYEINYIQQDVDKFDSERKHYQELYDELDIIKI
jgi:CII-binding regulator of phage lambda lysogenization HflD